MKFVIGLVLSVLVLQALAMPAAEETPKPRNEIVDAFREEIDRWFVLYQTFYDRTNAAMQTYRLQHVALVSQVYHTFMIAFGDRIEVVRVISAELNQLIDDRRDQLGGVNPCLQGIMDERDANSADVGQRINACALNANTTLSDALLNIFYPTFAQIQFQTSLVPISVIDVLSRGNVLEDEQAIIQYLDDRYHAYEMQWLASVSQLLRWESSRFEIEGLFLADQTSICMDDATWQFILTNSRLEGEVQTC